MNFKLGKEIFFKCDGNSFVIEREYGKEYKKCLIPKEYELAWRNEIRNQLYQDIYDSNGDERYSYFLRLSNIISLDDAIDLTIKILASNLDYFERLLYTEFLKKTNLRICNPELDKEVLKNKTILTKNIELVKLDSKKYSIIYENRIVERIIAL